MKKLFVLLVAAAIVGVVLSNEKSPGRPRGADVDAEESTATAQQEVRPSATASGRTPEPAPQRKRAPETTAAVAPTPFPAAASVATAAEPESPVDPFEEELARSQEMLEAGKLLEARRLLTPLYLESRGEKAQRIRKVLDRISQELVFNPRNLDGATIHTVRSGETLGQIAKQYGVSWRMIQRLNKVDPSRLQVGQKLKVLTGEPRIVVWRDEFRMALLIDGAYVKEYPIGIGKDDKTPIASFTVANKLMHPKWYRPGGGVVDYGDPENALGERWIGFANRPGLNGFGIHGNNDEPSIGTKCSNGCLRMHNDDVEELYDFVTVGTKVEIRK